MYEMEVISLGSFDGSVSLPTTVQRGGIGYAHASSTLLEHMSQESVCLGDSLSDYAQWGRPRLESGYGNFIVRVPRPYIRPPSVALSWRLPATATTVNEGYSYTSSPAVHEFANAWFISSVDSDSEVTIEQSCVFDLKSDDVLPILTIRPADYLRLEGQRSFWRLLDSFKGRFRIGGDSDLSELSPYSQQQSFDWMLHSRYGETHWPDLRLRELSRRSIDEILSQVILELEEKQKFGSKSELIVHLRDALVFAVASRMRLRIRVATESPYDSLAAPSTREWILDFSLRAGTPPPGLDSFPSRFVRLALDIVERVDGVQNELRRRRPKFTSNFRSTPTPHISYAFLRRHPTTHRCGSSRNDARSHGCTQRERCARFGRYFDLGRVTRSIRPRSRREVVHYIQLAPRHRSNRGQTRTTLNFAQEVCQ